MSERPPFDPSRIAPPPALPATPSDGAPLSPRQVNDLVQGAINRHVPATLHVAGEVGDLSRPGSGHWYFSLKDATAELRCVMWRSAAAKVKFEPRTGLAVIATGGLEVYTPRGTYQFIVRRLEPRGIGALELAFRQLREKLEREGLFATARKRPLPPLPERIALVTSPSGAALHDILRTLRRRFPSVEVLLFPVRVQGPGAAEEIAAAITRLNQLAVKFGGIDAAIVGRGGGSLEDLWAFNEECVARAIFASGVPIVSAVGHEVDVTISDLVADVRAATPTAAAELLTPDRMRLLSSLAGTSAALLRDLGRRLRLEQAHLRANAGRDALARPGQRLRLRIQRLDELARDAREAVVSRGSSARHALHRAELRLAICVSSGVFVRLRRKLAASPGWVARIVGAARQEAERRFSRALGRVERSVPSNRLRMLREHVAELRRRAQTGIRRALERRIAALAARRAEIVTGDPRRVLGRGYSITRDARTRRILRSPHEVKQGQRIITTLADGEIRSTADDPRQGNLFD